MQTIYLTSENKQEGKTSFTITLAHYLLTKGLNIGILNPLCNKYDESVYHKLLGKKENDYSGKYTVITNNKFDIKNVVDSYNQLIKNKIDFLLIDGNNSISIENINLILHKINATIIFLAKYNPQLNEKYFAKYHNNFKGNILFVINQTYKFATHQVETKIIPKLNSSKITCLGYIPEDKLLLAITPDQIAQFIKGEIVNQYDGEKFLVENFLIGGMGMDPAEYHFNHYKNKCIIVRGDRPDIQMSALNSNCSCIILTNNIKPIEYIQNEADLEQVPIIVTETDTLETIDKLNGLNKNTFFNHSLKLDRYLELFRSNIQLDQIFNINK